MKVKLPLIILCILTVSCFHRLPKMSYEDYLTTVSQLEEQGKYNEARDLSFHALNHFDENEFDILKEIIYINRESGHYEDNINLWQQGHEKGYFFFIHPALPWYKPYLEMDGFDEIASRDMAMRDSANSHSQCIYSIVTEERLDNEMYPLILIFHGGGSSIRNAQENWIIPQAMMDEYIIAFVQSYRHNDFNTYGWGVGDSVLYSQMRDVFNGICMEANVNTERIYCMGISAGASAALDISANGIIDVKGIYAICPAIPVNFLAKHARGLLDINIAIVCGENDRMIERQKEMFDILKDNSINTMFTVMKDMEHEFPPNQEEHLNDALNFMRCE